MMEHFDTELIMEKKYFAQTILLIKDQLLQEEAKNSDDKSKLISSRKEMWENTVHFSDDFDKLLEINQYLAPLGLQTSSYETATKKTKLLQKMLMTPYFARVDFIEDGYDKEKIYIGLSSLTDDKSLQTYIYDWRAPISSIFYRYELGAVRYEAPMGEIHGEVSLKRQYEIKDGELEYFFDANLYIADEFLKNLLSKNTSTKMKTIVETIQRDQDMIIRDMENELLIVQGVAGSGKTSVALHRVAYLMYKGLSSRLGINNMIIISPNTLFGQYISNVLPELGEDNVQSLVFEDISVQILREDCKTMESRNQFLEKLIVCNDFKDGKTAKETMKSSMDFKTSQTFITILQRLIWHFEHQMIKFSDVYYDNKYIAHRHSLKATLLRGEPVTPLAIRLKKLETSILEKVREKRKERIVSLERFVKNYPSLEFEAKAFARLLSIDESAALLSDIHKFTEIHYLKLYQSLFQDKNLLYQLADGLQLPENIEQIIQYSKENLQSDTLVYEDTLALLYLKIQMAGTKNYKEIKQVVIDEAQDYSPIHFEILKALFSKARYTILGDVNQTIEKQADLTIYDDMRSILSKTTSSMIVMNKSFRCTNEILSFSTKLLGNTTEIESFNRNGTPPEIIKCVDLPKLDDSLVKEILVCQNLGYESIGLLCKSAKDALSLYERLKNRLNITLIDDNSVDTVTGLLIIPLYMAKGLEFDAALVYGTDEERYKTEDDKKLLYIACTRPLHRLTLFHTGTQSKFLNQEVDCCGVK